MKCANCNDDLELSVKRVIQAAKGELSLCEKCVEFDSVPETAHSVEEEGAQPDNVFNVEGFEVLSNMKELPDEILDQIKEKAKAQGITPEEGRFIALTSDELDPDFEKKMHLLKARNEFMTATNATLSAIHSLKHIGVATPVLEKLIMDFTRLEYLMVTEYLFDREALPDNPKVEDLYAVNLDIIMDCGD